MNNLGQSYKKILEVLSKFFGKKLQNYQRRKPKISDLEVVSLALTAEYLSIDSECQLFRKIPESIKSKTKRSVFNRRRRKLFPFLEPQVCTPLFISNSKKPLGVSVKSVTSNVENTLVDFLIEFFTVVVHCFPRIGITL